MKQETLTIADGTMLTEVMQLPVHAAEDLTAGKGKAIITLGGQPYKLQITRQGKLLLTK